MSRAKKNLSEKLGTSVQVYMTVDFKEKLQEFSVKEKCSDAQIVREGILLRMNSDQFNAGFNESLNKASEMIANLDAAKMRFPSGTSIAEYLCNELNKLRRRDG